MTARAEAIARGEAPELVWLLEHPPLYTAGTSARPSELLDARFPVFETGRGGQLTYHGPGQRVGYAMLDLKRRVPDVRRFVATIEEWIIRTLASFNVRGERRDDRVGVWVRRPDKGTNFEDKIAAIGIRVRHWVTLHGFALNVEPELSHFPASCPAASPRRATASPRSPISACPSRCRKWTWRCGPRSCLCSAMPSVIRKSGSRHSEKIMLRQSDHAVASTENNSSPRRSLTSPGLASR